jgi:hypothetical protein
LANGNPASFEHHHKAAWIKKMQEERTNAILLKQNSELVNKTCKLEIQLQQIQEIEESLRDNLKFELKQKSIREGQWEQQRKQFNDNIMRLMAEVSECKERFQKLELDNREYVEDLQSRHNKEVEELKSKITVLEISQRSGAGGSENNSGK